MPGCLNCKHYETKYPKDEYGMPNISIDNAIRICNNGKQGTCDQWWADNANVPSDQASAAPCFEKTELVAFLDEAIAESQRLLDMLKKNNNGN